MNTIELVTKYLPVLDEQYRYASKSAILDTPMEFIQQTGNAKKFKIAKIICDGLADYSRSGGFVDGDTSLDWTEYEYTVDRGRSLAIDSMDNMETFGLAFGRLAGTFQKDHVIPEMDAIRFAKYYQGAGTKVSKSLTTSNVFSTVDDIIEVMTNAEVPDGNKVIFANPHTYKLMINDSSITRYLTVNDELSKALNKKIYSYNEMPIIEVPKPRFYSEIELLDGSSVGETAGGYKEATGANVIGFLIISFSSVVQVAKRIISRFWAPTKAEMVANNADGVNPKSDAWKFDYRCYHDAWVLENKVLGVAGVIDLPTITIAATASVAVGATLQLAPVITGPENVVSYTSATPAKATVSSSGLVTGVEAGSSVITIKVGSVTATVTVTVS